MTTTSDEDSVTTYLHGRKVTISGDRPRDGLPLPEKRIRLQNCGLGGCGEVITVDLDHHTTDAEYCSKEHQQKSHYLKRTEQPHDPS